MLRFCKTEGVGVSPLNRQKGYAFHISKRVEREVTKHRCENGNNNEICHIFMTIPNLHCSLRNLKKKGGGHSRYY